MGQHMKKHTEKRKIDHLRLFISKLELLKITVYLQTAFADETCLAEGPLL
jgi:hypothetical protein